jgi:hypothetical protein
LAEKSGSSVPEAHTFGISRFSQARFPAIPNPPMRRRVYGEVCTGCQGFFCKLPSDLGSFAVGACCQPVSQASSLVVLRGPATVAVPPVCIGCHLISRTVCLHKRFAACNVA